MATMLVSNEIVLAAAAEFIDRYHKTNDAETEQIYQEGYKRYLEARKPISLKQRLINFFSFKFFSFQTEDRATACGHPEKSYEEFVAWNEKWRFHARRDIMYFYDRNRKDWRGSNQYYRVENLQQMARLAMDGQQIALNEENIRDLGLVDKLCP